eukprot:CAMPEP_0170861472 /NCGR_PEP_ID=MMETSP0734-20130129/18248_1 /TAXON_ID=186038 /ORGANISM="Fragilariopsis kerguelensis, Strain L26-C5" /LENGTH=258 /DNA_ID=CAMNT_0011235587 /DNA_START=346 /DNA_END=1121 /DNA_ORIENTATION=-
MTTTSYATNNATAHASTSTFLDIEVVVEGNNTTSGEVVERKSNLRISLPSSATTGILKSFKVCLTHPLMRGKQHQFTSTTTVSPAEQKQQQKEKYYHPQAPISSTSASVSVSESAGASAFAAMVALMSPRPLGTLVFKRMVATAMADVVPSEHYDYYPRPLPLDHEHNVATSLSSSLPSSLPSLSPSALSSSISPPKISGDIPISTPSITTFKYESNTSSSSSSSRYKTQPRLPLKKRTFLPLNVDLLSSSPNKRARK